jgi:hypothetical protein
MTFNGRAGKLRTVHNGDGTMNNVAEMRRTNGIVIVVPNRRPQI